MEQRDISVFIGISHFDYSKLTLGAPKIALPLPASHLL